MYLTSIAISFAVFPLTYFDMLGSVVGEPLVHLVTETQHVMLDAQVGDHLQFFPFVDLQ